MDLFSAIKEGNFDNLKSIHLNATNSEGFLPLTYAISLARYKIAEILLEIGANPNAEDSNGMTPLIAALNRTFVNTKTLKPEDNSKTKMDEEKLLAFLKYLIARGANLNVYHPQNKKSALNLAIFKCGFQVTKLFIENGAKINHRDKSCFIPIIAAIEKENVEIVKLLVQKGAYLVLPNVTGRNALTLAIEKGNLEIIEILIRYLKKLNRGFGLINEHDNKGEIPINMAIKNNHMEIIKILIFLGVDLNMTDYYGNLPLGEAIMQENLDLAKFLIVHKADVNLCQGSEWSRWVSSTNIDQRPIELAVFSKNVDMVKLLVSNGANVNYVANSEGRSLLNWACAESTLEIVKVLVENGAKINAVDSNFMTAMHTATVYKKTEIMKYLAENGACMNTKTKPSAIFPTLELKPLEIALGIKNMYNYKMLLLNLSNRSSEQ